MREKLSATESELAESSAALRAMEGEAAATALEWSVALTRLEEENKALEAARRVTESHLVATRAELAEATDALFPEQPVSLRVAVVEKKEVVSLSLNVIQSPDDDGAEMAAAAEAAVRAARAETFAARDARDEAVTELEAARARAAELASALAESREDGDARDARLASATAEGRETERRLRAVETELRAELRAERASLASASSRLETQSAKTETLAARAEAAEEATRESVLRVGEEMRLTAQARAETLALRAQLEKTLVALADAESRADEETTASSNAAEAADTETETETRREEASRDERAVSSKAKLASLRDELNARRAREAELEADAARLRAALDDAESRLVRLASDAEARRAEAAEAAAADAAEAAAAETRRRLSSSEAAAEHARSMLAAKELALADVEARARAAAEAAEEATRRSETAEAAAEEAQREAAALAAERAATAAEAPPEEKNSSSPGVAAFGSVVDSWRSAVAAKAAEAERLRGSLSELLVSQTHAARLRKEAEARAAELETERRDAETAFESRLAALRQALGAAESARADADADAETYKRALVAAKEDCERLELEAAVSKHKNDEGTQAKLLIVQAESSELRAKVEKRNREVRELNRMLKAWEAMRHSKDAQIEKLVERCKKFEDEATEKARAIESMRKASRLGSGHKRDGFPSSGRESSRRVALAPAVAAADKENPGSPGAAKLAAALEGKSPYGKKGSVSPASASLAAFKRKSHVPRADAVPGFRERLDSVVGR